MEFGKPSTNQDLADFILSRIKDKTLINEGISDAVSGIEEILKNGIDIAMNKYN